MLCYLQYVLHLYDVITTCISILMVLQHAECFVSLSQHLNILLNVTLYILHVFWLPVRHQHVRADAFDAACATSHQVDRVSWSFASL